MRQRPLLLVAAGGLLVAGCSSSADRSTTVPSASVTFATASSTTVAASTPSPTTARPTTTMAAPTSTSTGPSTSASTSSVAPTTGASTTATPTTGAPTTVAASFTPAPGPSVPGATHPVSAAWVDPATQELLSVDDATYWATVVGQGTGDGGVKFVSFRLVQAFFGDACTAQFGNDACDNDLGTLESPSGTMPLFLGASRITVADPSTQQSYAVSGDVLFELIADPTAAVGAPAGYIYAPFAYLLEVQGGQIVAAEQVWTP